MEPPQALEPVDLLVFGPHPDDLEIGAGGTVAKHSAMGLRVGLCDLTGGEMGSNGTVEERLVEAEDDLRETNPPSNRELFDYLASDFVANKYDMKHLIRQIMNSAAYQRSSKKVTGNEADNRYYSRYLVRRLSGEVILDCLSQVTAAPTVFNQVYTGVEGGTAVPLNSGTDPRFSFLMTRRVRSRPIAPPTTASAIRPSGCSVAA